VAAPELQPTACSRPVAPSGCFLELIKEDFQSLRAPRQRRCVRALPVPWPEEQPRCGVRVVDAPSQPGAPEERIKVGDTASPRNMNTHLKSGWIRPGM